MCREKSRRKQVLRKERNKNKENKSVVQPQKHFYKRRHKERSMTGFTNLILLHDKRIEDMILVMKDSATASNLNLNKQMIQYSKVVKSLNRQNFSVANRRN